MTGVMAIASSVGRSACSYQEAQPGKATAHADDLSSSEIIERRICAIDEATAHHSPGVE
jgi:hypothetical protein